MESVAGEPISDWSEYRIAGAKRYALEPFCNGLRLTTFARVVVYTVQRRENLEHGAHVVQPLGGVERLPQEHPDSFVRPHRINQRSQKREMQLHREGRTHVRIGLKAVERTLDTLPALDH
jgi:hypothetical protein